MENIALLHQEAINYSRRIFNSGKSTLEYYDDTISDILYPIKRGQDKIVFLSKLKEIIISMRDEHRTKCKNPDTCNNEIMYRSALYIIDAFLEDIAKEYDYKPDNEAENFTADDISNLNKKIDDIITILMAQGEVQEDILVQINDLRYHFNLGKRNWFQLFTGKLIDWAGSGLSGVVIGQIAQELGIIENLQKAIEMFPK